MGPRNVASCQKQTVHGFRDQRPVGDGVFFLLFEFVLRTGLVQPRSVEAVDVKIKETTRCDPILKEMGAFNVLLLHGVEAHKMAGLAHAEQRGGGEEETVFVAGRVAAQEIDDQRDLFAAGEISSRDLLNLGAVDAGAVGHVHRYHARQAGGIEQHMSGRRGKLLAAQRLDFAVGHLDEILKLAGINGVVHVHAADFEHHRDRLHPAVAFAALHEFCARFGGDVAVAAGIDDHLGQNRFPARLAFGDHPDDPVAFHDHVGHKRVELDGHACLLQHIHHGLAGFLRVNDVLRFENLRPVVVEIAGGVPRALQQFVQDRPLRVACPVAHGARGGYAANGRGLFQDHGLCSCSRRRDRRAEAAGAGTANKDVDFGFNGDFAGGL